MPQKKEKDPTTKSNTKARELLKEKGGVLCVLSVQRVVLLDRRLGWGCQGKGPNRAEAESSSRSAVLMAWAGHVMDRVTSLHG